jgi:hypothetical protein
MLWLLAACGSSLLVGAVVLGTFVPLQSSDGVEYLFAGPRISTLLSAWLISVAALSSAYAVVLARARARSPQHAAAARTGRWLSPLCLLSGLVFGILPAAPGIGERGAVAAYFLYDLRWWWLVRRRRCVGAPACCRRTLTALPIARRPAPDRAVSF